MEVSTIIELLIAEDEPIMRDFLRGLVDWETYGYHLVDIACDGQEAMDIISSRHIDVVMTDIKMPIINGIELMQRTRDIAPHIKFLVLSGFDDFELVSQAFKLGAVDYFLKAELSVEKIQEQFIKLADELQQEQHTAAGQATGRLIKDLRIHKEKVRNLEQILYKNRWVTRGTILNDLMWDGGTHSELEISSAGLHIKEGCLRVMVIKVYRYNELAENDWEGSVELLNFAFVNVIQEILDGSHGGDVFCKVPGEFVVELSRIGLGQQRPKLLDKRR